MARHLRESLQGYVRIRISGAACGRFLNLCAFHHIVMWELIPAGDAYEASLTVRDFRRLKEIVRKSKVSLRIVQRCGFPFFLHRYRKRKFYVIGIMAAACLLLWLSSHVWRITIDGNVSQTDETLFAYLEEHGIYHGMRKSGVDCHALAAELRNSFGAFSWVAAELEGTQLQIHVREGMYGKTEAANEQVPDYPQGNISETPSSLAAPEDGTLVSLYVRKGVALSKAGDEVKKGQILVTGALPVYNDSQEVAGYQYVAADADIVIRTELAYSDTAQAAIRQKVYTGREKTQYLLEAGDLPFALPSSFDSLSRYDVTGAEHQMRLAEHFYLPVRLVAYTAREYEYCEVLRSQEELEALLAANLQIFMKNLEEKGVQIFENNVKIEWSGTSAIASGTLSVGITGADRVALTAESPEPQS